VVNLFLFLKLWIGRDILISMLVVDHFNACNILVPNLSVSKRVPSRLCWIWCAVTLDERKGTTLARRSKCTAPTKQSKGRAASTTRVPSIPKLLFIHCFRLIHLHPNITVMGKPVVGSELKDATTAHRLMVAAVAWQWRVPYHWSIGHRLHVACMV